jgi:hypothetical protein
MMAPWALWADASFTRVLASSFAALASSLRDFGSTRPVLRTVAILLWAVRIGDSELSIGRPSEGVLGNSRDTSEVAGLPCKDFVDVSKGND